MIATGKLIAAMVLLAMPMYGIAGHRTGDYRSGTFWMSFPLTAAAMLIAGFLLAANGILWAFFPLWGVAALSVLWVCRKDWKNKNKLPLPHWQTFLPGAVIFLLQAMPAAMQEFPAGWDPACHALIAEKIRLTGALCADWRPFEDLPMLYPQSFHVFATLLAMLTGCETHTVLQNLHLLFTFPATMLVWHIASTVFDRKTGLFAAAAYAFLTDTGNYLYFYRMGMLPTECANGMFLAMLLLLLRHDWQYRLKSILAGLGGAGIFLAHPLSGVITVCTGGAVACFCASRDWRKLLAFLLSGGCAAMALYLFLTKHALSGGNTESIKFAEEPAMPVFHVLEEIGWSVLPLAALGIWFAWKNRNRPEIRMLLAWLGVLTGVFAVMEYGFRFGIAEVFFGENFTIGIPSRFIAVSGSIFSIWAGYGMAKLSDLRPGKILIVIFLIFCGSGVWRYFQLAKTQNVPEELQQLSAAVRQETPEEAYFLLPSGTEAYQWFSYLAWRASLGVPIPSSENRALLTEKWLLFGDLDGNQEKIGAYLREHRMICMLLIPAAPGHWQMAMGMPDGRFRLLRQELHFTTQQQLHSKREN